MGTGLALVVLISAVAWGVSRSGGTADAGTGPPASNPTSGSTGPSPKGSKSSQPPTTKPSTSKPTKPAQRPLTDTQIVTANRLYKAGAASASKCHEPPARPTSVAAVRSYYTRFLPCLNKTWKPIIERAGKRFYSPRLVVFTGHNTPTPCGGSGDTGFYCDGTIYLSATVDMDDYRKFSKVWTRANMAFLIGHEYGHHVQNLTGILASSWDRQRAMSSGSAALEESRRRELQASCLSMVYLGADRNYFPVSGGIRTWLRWAVYHRGDQWNPKRDHGDKNNHGFWSMRGFDSRNPSRCNTFTASHKVVG